MGRATRRHGDLAVGRRRHTILHNEFSVGADIETVWHHLLDIESVAICLPGATITGTGEQNAYDGSMRLKIGPMRVEYRGTARLSEVDEPSRTAVISLSAREAKGQGSAMATIRNRLEAVDGGTRVVAETDLQITGPQAQFGRGVIEDVGKRVLGEFSRCLEERIGGAPSAESVAHTADAELDVGSLLARTPAVRAGAAVALVFVLVLIVWWRRR